jgi:ribonuclease P protein component
MDDDALRRSFRPEDRVRRRSEFREAQSRGQRVHTRHFVIVLYPRAGQRRRLGITVTKKVCSAVGRNRVKRVVREVFRRNRDYFPESFDVVFIAKNGAPTLGYEDVLGEVANAAPGIHAAARRGLRHHGSRRRA